MKKIISILFVTLVLVCASCSTETEQQPVVDNIPTSIYSMRLSADVHSFETGTTRADGGYQWEDMARIYLRFHVGEDVVSGTAVYSLGSQEWTVTTNQSLPTDIDGDCEAYYFVNTDGQSGQSVKLTVQSIVYQDMEGSFVLTEDNALLVRLLLAPRTGRVRFKGKPSTAFAVTGLTSMTTYDIASNTFSTSDAKLVGKLDAEGDAGYYYVCFTDAEKRQLTVDAIGKGAYLRTFGEEVLAAGQSGYITLPNMENMSGWTLVNVDNQQEIVLATVSTTEISNIRSKFATLKAMVGDNGNGTLSETGFVYALNSNPTIDNGTKVALGKSSQMQVRLSNLSAETTYYVRAYAQNERGIAYGSATSFTTLSAEEDGTIFGKDGYGGDEDLNGDNSSSGTIDKGSFGDDEDLNSTNSSSGTINKDGYKDDENWN